MMKMKRNMEAMATFIARAQMDSAGDRTPSGSSAEAVGMGGAVQPPTSASTEPIGPVGGKAFEQLSAMEMADVLSRRITGWQSRFAVDQVV
jgi:hypothetical protein